MKKTVLVLALAIVLVLTMASTAFAKNAGAPSVVQTGTSQGFVKWSAALTAVSAGTSAAFPSGTSIDPLQASGPHANYSTTTIKCAVCHSTHGAPAGSFLLTQATGGAGGTASIVCSYCHGRGATASTHIVSLAIGSSTSPHSGRCAGGCHASSPHGVGVSTYSLMASKLIRNNVDTPIADAIGASAGVTGLTAADFDAASNTDGFKVVTGYVCGQTGCHNNSAFAIKSRGNQMWTQQSTAVGPASYRTGHPVIAAARSMYVPPAGSAFTTAAGKAVAWKPTDGCKSCHSAVDTALANQPRFPHNMPEDGSGKLWMTVAADASQPETNTDAAWSMDGADYGSVQDGACIKCHVSGTGSGAGITY